MKKLAIILLAAAMLLAAGLPLSAKAKLNADGFLKYLEANRTAIPYADIEKIPQGDTLTLKIFLPKTAQEPLLKAIERAAHAGFSFESQDAETVACSIVFKAAAAKSECPGKVTVISETLKPQPFQEYREYSGAARPETVVVKSPTAGTVSLLKVLAGSLVEKGQELLSLNAGVNEEVKALEQEALRKQKILKARQGWKVKSEKAVLSAENDYKKTLAQLEQKKAQAAQVVAAPLAGTVQSIAVAAGAETALDAELLVISSSSHLLVRAPLAADDAGRFVALETITGRVAGVDAEFAAEVVAVEAEAVTLRLDNSRGLVKPEAVFTVRKRVAEHAAALVVPAAALAKDSLGDYVYVAEKGKAKKTYVTAAAAVDGMVLVAQGLAPEAQLVVSGHECLADGKKLQVVSREQLAKEKAEADARQQKQQADADARLKKEQAAAAAKEEARAKKEKEKADKLAAKQAKKEGAAVTPAAEAKEAPPAVELLKPECAKRVQVLAAPVKPETFLEYRYYSAPLLADVMAVTGFAAGKVSEVKVVEGSLVEKGQELVLIDTSLDAEIIKLQQEAARKLRALDSLRNAAKPSTKAIQSAERDYQKTMEQLAQKNTRFAHAILAPVSGIVQNLKAVAGSDTAAEALLLEISTEEYLVAKIPLNMADSGGEQISGRVAGLDDEVTAQITGLSASQLILRVSNAERRIKAGSVFSARRLKTQHNNAVVIPSSAMFRDSLGDYVYVVEKKKARKTYVGIGAREADRILVLQGLAAEMPLILSGYECLADGRKISMIFPEDLARGRAYSQEQPAAEKIPGGSFVNRMKVGVHGSFYMMMGENFKNTYKDLSGFGGEISLRFSNKMDFWLSGGLAMKKAAVDWSSEELSFQMIPLAGAFRYYLLDNRKFNAYVGAGPNFFLVTDKNPAGDIKSTLIGFHGMAGGYYKLSRKFSLQLMAKFNMVKKDVVPDSEVDLPLDLTGLQFNLGVAFSL